MIFLFQSWFTAFLSSGFQRMSMIFSPFFCLIYLHFHVFLALVNSNTLQLLLTIFFCLFKILYLMRFLFLLCLITLCLVSNSWILNQCSCISAFSEFGYFTIPSNYFASSVCLIPTFILSILDFVSNEISILIIPIYTFLDYHLVDLQQILQNCPCFSALLPPIISLRL